MSKYIKCTDDYCYVLNKQDTLIFDSVDDLLYSKFDINKGGYKQDLVITVYTKKLLKPASVVLLMLSICLKSLTAYLKKSMISKIEIHIRI